MIGAPIGTPIGGVSGSAVVGAGSSTEAADTAVAAGVVLIAGSGAATEGADTAAATGIVVSLDGAGAATEGADTAAGFGSARIPYIASPAISAGRGRGPGILAGRAIGGISAGRGRTTIGRL